jgi:ectoine hydroxylase-related dioxygenase (phytanoyl-CoA dioxygenase family)
MNLATATSIITASEIKRYRERGFAKFESCLDPMYLERFRPEIARVVREMTAAQAPLAERGTYGKAFLQAINLWQRSALIEEFVRNQHLARIAAELMGCTNVRVYHDQGLFKEPGGGFTPWHCDQVYWPLECRTITAWIPLVPVPLEMGPLQFSIGSHRADFGRHLTIGDESERVLARTLKDLPVEEQPFALGDVSFHDGWTFHRAGSNTTEHMRDVMTVIYYPDGARMIAPRSGAHERDGAKFFPGIVPGQVAATEMNPLLL